MLKKIRVGVSIILFTLITFYFVDFAELIPNKYLAWTAKIQLIPAILSISIVTLLVIFATTILLGRIYCSSICPMGVYQDIVSWVSKKFSKKRKYAYSRAKTVMRLSALGLAIIAVLSGYSAFLGFIEPYSAYGRIVSNIFQLAYLAGNNVLESIYTYFGNYIFYKSNIVISNTFAFSTAVVTLLTIGYLAWKYGRTFCNTICPVGTILGYLSKYSLFKVNINNSKCNACGLCATKCKASCIDSKSHSVDRTRCVSCFNCLDICKKGALSYSLNGNGKKEKTEIIEPVTESTDTSKRSFLKFTIATAVTAPVAMAQSKADALMGNQGYVRKVAIAPPGAGSVDNLQQKCTSCHLCISKCPSKVLKPAFMEYGIAGIMQPIMFFERGFCNFDCTICSDVCPNGALKSLSKEEKHLNQGGYVILNEDICVVYTDGTSCGACAEHCPTQAVTMVPYKNGLTKPQIDTEICIGCGGCEFICPVRPHRAIFVEGHTVHRQAKPFEKGEKQNIQLDDFGF